MQCGGHQRPATGAAATCIAQQKQATVKEVQNQLVYSTSRITTLTSSLCHSIIDGIFREVASSAGAGKRHLWSTASGVIPFCKGQWAMSGEFNWTLILPGTSCALPDCVPTCACLMLQACSAEAWQVMCGSAILLARPNPTP